MHYRELRYSFRRGEESKAEANQELSRPGSEGLGDDDTSRAADKASQSHGQPGTKPFRHHSEVVVVVGEWRVVSGGKKETRA